MLYRSAFVDIQSVRDEHDEEEEDTDAQSIKIYAFQSVLLEIMGNGCISTVTLFQDRDFVPLKVMEEARQGQGDEEEDEVEAEEEKAMRPSSSHVLFAHCKYFEHFEHFESVAAVQVD